MESIQEDENEWTWKQLCGPAGFSLWEPDKNDFGMCFERISIQFPSLALLAWVSAYYYGNESIWVSRSYQQLLIINGRSVAILLLALNPILYIIVSLAMVPESLALIDYVISGMECFSWLVHLLYVVALKTRLNISPRGPLPVIVVWIINFIVTCISLRSHSIRSSNQNLPHLLNLAFSAASVTFLVSYAITLFPSEQMGSSRYEELGQTIPQYISERQPLLSPGVGSIFSRLSEDRDPNYLGVAKEQSSFFSKLLFNWVNPLMRKGLEGRLNSADDLFDLPLNMSSAVVSYELNLALLGQQVENHSSTYESTGTTEPPNVSYRPAHNVSLIRALHKCFGLQFYGIGILKFIANCAGFFGPLLLNRLVTFIEVKNEPLFHGYMYALGLLAVTLIAAFCNVHFNYFMAEVGLKIRASIISTIYRKTLLLNSTTISKFSAGEIVNFMSTDTDRIVNSCPSFHAFWSIPFELAVTLFLLYKQVGLAFLAGVAFSIVLIPVNKVIATKIGTLSTKLMEYKDQRVKMITEVLHGIRVLKFHQWENQFIDKINKLRLQEIKYLRGRKYLDALCVYFWATTPVFISILTFTSYSLMGHRLTAATVFTTVALLNMLISPLNAFPWVLNGLIEAWVSIKRVERLIKLPDLVLANFYSKLPPDQSMIDIFIDNATFSWEEKAPVNTEENLVGQNESIFQLQEIKLKVHKGQFIGIMGKVGSGKSTLLAALLAELEKEEGTISVSETDSGFGFVSQKPWLQRGTIKDNILFGKTYDQAKYRTVIEACCLEEDLKLLHNGDLTGVGEGGVTLSGGQKARIALARAVYQDKSIYFLDDVLSSVDIHVAHNIFQKCINGLLRNKTKILCTHQVQYFLTADKIFVLDGGKIVNQGKPGDILSDFDEISAQMESLDDPYLPVRRKISRVEKDGDDLSVTNSIISNEEERETGAVKLGIYKNYWLSVGNLLAVTILLSMLLMQISRNMSDWWLSYWVTHSSSSDSDNSSSVFNGKNPYDIIDMHRNNFYVTNFSEVYTDDTVFFLSIYGGIAGLNTLFTLFRAFLFAYGGINAAKNIHSLLLKTIIKAKVVFFDVSPLGRILNRFSSDTYTVDDSLPFIMNILFAQLFSVFGAVLVTIYGVPWLVLIFIPLVPFYYWLQKYYRMTSRELKRLSSVTLSPLYSHFNETLQGLQTIRAFRSVSRFKLENEEYLESNQKAQLASQAAGQWLGLRIQFVGVVLVSGVGLIAVIQHQFSVSNPGLVGLAISYALSISNLLGGVVNAFVETEREMVAVERVYQYIDTVDPEETVGTPYEVCPYGWPFQGVVIFYNVVLKYRENLPPSLKGVYFQTRPAEKVGIVGRTGAGKSSLFAALFRLTELYEGEIFVDTVNISLINLADLRSRIAIIPQDPFLFSGSVRENLDPGGSRYTDTELWSALQKCHLGAVVRRMGGLDAQVNSGEASFSAGQCQLFCLARALLHNAKILCIDEATANVDQETDRHIQRTIRSAFCQSTVLTIAHRVSTVLDSDRVLVMGDGQVLEFGTPDELLQDKNSYFYNIAHQEFL